MAGTVSDEKRPLRITYADFDAFYAACWDEMYRSLAVTLRDHDLARESVDEAMTRAYQRWSSVRTYSSQCGWIYRVGLNWAISQKRKTKREVHTPIVIDGTVDESLPDPDLHAALARLGVEQRAVVVLRYLLDWSEEDTANTLEIPRGTVKSRLNRAMAKLREELS